MISGAFLFIARAWTQLASAVVLLLAARLLDQTSIGVFTLASALSMVLTQWVGVGTYEYVLREREDPDVPSTAFWVNVGIAIALLLIGLFVAHFSAAWFRAPQLPHLVQALVPLTLASAARSAAEAIMIRDGRLSRLAVGTAVSETLGLVAGLGALMAGWGLWSLVIHKWMQLWSAAILLMASAKWRPALKFNPETALRMAKFGVGLLGERIILFFQMYGVDLVLGILLNPAAVAVYRLGARLVLAVTTIIQEPMRQMNWKRMTDAAATGGSVARAAEAQIIIFYAVIAGPVVGMAVTSDLLVRVLLGEKWLACVPVIRLLCVVPLFGLAQQLTDSVLGASGRTSLLPPLRLMAVVLMFSLLAYFSRFGTVGAAAVQPIVALVMFVAAMVVQSKIAGVRPMAYVPRVGVILALAGLMAAAVGLTRQGLHVLGAGATLQLISSIVVGLSVYGAGMTLLFGEQVRPVIQALRAARR